MAGGDLLIVFSCTSKIGICKKANRASKALLSCGKNEIDHDEGSAGVTVQPIGGRVVREQDGTTRTVRITMTSQG